MSAAYHVFHFGPQAFPDRKGSRGKELRGQADTGADSNLQVWRSGHLVDNIWPMGDENWQKHVSLFQASNGGISESYSIEFLGVLH